MERSDHVNTYSKKSEGFHVLDVSHVWQCDRLSDTLQQEKIIYCSVSCLEAVLLKGLQASGYVNHKHASGKKENDACEIS